MKWAFFILKVTPERSETVNFKGPLPPRPLPERMSPKGSKSIIAVK